MSSLPTDSPLSPPTALTTFVADKWPRVLAGPVLVHIAHYQYLSRYRKPDPNNLKNARFWAVAGGAWMLVYLSTITGTVRKTSPPTMSADFWAGYVSGAVGIIIGNPLDVIKVRLQAKDGIAVQTPSSYIRQFGSITSLVSGTAAPVLGYGALNALLFVSYNRTEAALNKALSIESSLWTTWVAGAVGGLTTWVVSTPTELIKCKAQLSSPPTSSLAIAKQVWQAEGVRGLYFGGVVTALRDSIGYGFYFWSYELSTRLMASETGKDGSFQQEAAKVLLCGGLAGIVTWASIFPLDVIKTRVQTQAFTSHPETSPLVGSGPSETSTQKRLGAMQIARDAYREGGARVFFRGLTVCSIRAFIVNAVQWAVYEWAMTEMGQGRRRPPAPSKDIVSI